MRIISNLTKVCAVLFVFALAMLEIACSGFLVPASSLPEVMRLLSRFSSVQHYMAIVRGVMLRGAGLGVLWSPGLALGEIAFAVMTLAWLRLRLGLDADSLRQRLRAAWRVRRLARRAARRAKKSKLTGKPAYADVRVEADD